MRTGLLVFLLAGSATCGWSQDTSTDWIGQAERALARKDARAALKAARRAIEQNPQRGKAHFLHGEALSGLRQHAKAIQAYTKCLKREPNLALARDRRGDAYLKVGDLAKALEDFEAYLQVKPEAYKQHWRYGIACYYAKRYADGARQFKAGEAVFGNDVENAFWHYLCTARLDGVRKARQRLLKVGPDQRIPMMEIYAMIQGRSTPERVLQVARDPKYPANEKNRREFYAYLYIGLHHEAENRPNQALKALREADQRPIPDYMWDIAHLHLKLRQPKSP